MARKYPDGASVSCRFGDGEYLGQVVGWDGDAQRYLIGLVGLCSYEGLWRRRNLFPTNGRGELPIVKVQTHHLKSAESATIDDIWHKFASYLYKFFVPGSPSSDRQVDGVFNTLFDQQKVIPIGEPKFVDYVSTWRF